jgi:hypothetical protein
MATAGGLVFYGDGSGAFVAAKMSPEKPVGACAGNGCRRARVLAGKRLGTEVRQAGRGGRRPVVRDRWAPEPSTQWRCRYRGKASAAAAIRCCFAFFPKYFPKVYADCIEGSMRRSHRGGMQAA